jgi:hypothetical protein
VRDVFETVVPTVVSSWRVAAPFNGGKSFVFVVGKLWISPGSFVGKLWWFVLWGKEHAGGVFIFCVGGDVLIVAGALCHTASDESALRKFRLLSTAGVARDVYLCRSDWYLFILCVYATVIIIVRHVGMIKSL